MKNLLKIVLIIFTFLQLGVVNAQIKFDFKEKDNTLIINDSIVIAKDQELKINKPFTSDYVSIKPKESGLNLGKIGKIGALGGSVGLGIVGLGGVDTNTVSTGLDVMTAGNTISRAVDVIDDVQEISKGAKKIVGKTFIVTKWEEGSTQQEGFILWGTIDKKKYKIEIERAILFNEISFL